MYGILTVKNINFKKKYVKCLLHLLVSGRADCVWVFCMGDFAIDFSVLNFDPVCFICNIISLNISSLYILPMCKVKQA